MTRSSRRIIPLVILMIAAARIGSAPLTDVLNIPIIKIPKFFLPTTYDLAYTFCKVFLKMANVYSVPEILYNSPNIQACQLLVFSFANKFQVVITLSHPLLPTADRKCVLTLSVDDVKYWVQTLNTKTANDCMNLGLYIPANIK